MPRLPFTKLSVVGSNDNDRIFGPISENPINHPQHRGIDKEQLSNECVRDAEIVTIIECCFLTDWEQRSYRVDRMLLADGACLDEQKQTLGP